MMQRLAQAAAALVNGPSRQPPQSPGDREEQGFPPNAERSQNATPRPLERQVTIVRTDHNGLIPINDKLLTFRSLTGIDTVPTLSNVGHAIRAAPNIGIYPRVVEAEHKAAHSYRLYHIAINFCLGAQIIVAASLTALGAADGSRHAVTAFGAMNTIMAAILTYLKGSGLPDRFKNQETEWKEIREHIEQREREFCLADCTLDVQHEVVMVEDMYLKAKAEVDGNKAPSKRASLGCNLREHAHLGEHTNNREYAKGNWRDHANSSSIRSIVHKAAIKVAHSTTDEPSTSKQEKERELEKDEEREQDIHEERELEKDEES